MKSIVVKLIEAFKTLCQWASKRNRLNVTRIGTIAIAALFLAGGVHKYVNDRNISSIAIFFPSILIISMILISRFDRENRIIRWISKIAAALRGI